MALPDTLLVRLMETTKNHKLNGHLLMLGRQRYIGSREGKKSAEVFEESIARFFPKLKEEDLKNPDDEFSERFFEILGFSPVESLDYSDYENANIVHDLTKAPPKKLQNKFDVIYDGGTCGQIFDLPAAFRNIDKMLKPGGVLIAHSPCNNSINHGFYQITPELVYGYWNGAMGYEILELTLQPLLPSFINKTSKTSNPHATGKRLRLLSDLPKNSPIILNYVVRKPNEAQESPQEVLQTDYIRKWNEN